MFEKGQIYVRKDLHDQYGGQVQGGISTPSRYPIILIFAGQQGKQYGYLDGWAGDGLYLYTGEGQTGDMEFSRGNKAIRDHVVNDEELHLFESAGPGCVRYKGQMVCTGYEWKKAPDSTGQTRKAIVFHLRQSE